MGIFRLYTGTDGQSHLEELPLASHPELTSLQATAGIVFRTAQPGRFSDWHNAPRRQFVITLSGEAELGLGDACELPADEAGHVYHMYVVRSPERDRIAAALRQAEIGHATYYTTPLHLQPVFADLGYGEGSLRETERAARETIALPLWPGISPEQQERVVETVRAAVGVRARA